MKLTNNEILSLINNLYDITSDNVKNIFLCGATIEDDKTLRSFISKKFKKNPYYNIVFPEYLFESLIKRGEFNILSLENQLATDVDLIVLPLEGYGTFTELGVFSCQDILHDRIIIISDIKYKDELSFINLGPIKLIYKKNESHVIYFKKEEIETIPDEVALNMIYDELLKTIRYHRAKDENKNLFNIFGLSRFLLLIIALYEKINTDEIYNILEEYFGSKFPFDLIEPSIANLQKNELVESNKLEVDKDYYLSDNGRDYIFEELLEKLNLRKKYSQIRTLILNSKIRKIKNFDLKEERRRFLDL